MHIIVSNEGKFIKGLLGKIGCDFIFKRLCLQMSIAEYFCNHEQTFTSIHRLPHTLLKFLHNFLFFVFLSNKNMVYLLVKFGKWME